MKHDKTRKDSNGGVWDNYSAGGTKIQTHTTKKGAVAVFHNGKKINSKKNREG